MTSRAVPSPLLQLVPIAIVFALAAAALPSRADTIVSIDLSNITYIGNNTCGGTCKDVFNASWLWDATTDAIVPSSLTVSNTGILGSVALYATTTYSFQFNSTDPSTYQALSWYYSSNFPALGTYAINDLYLYCESGPCSTEFASDTYISPSSGKITIAAVSSVPESSSFLLLACGLSAVAGIASRKHLRERLTAIGALGRTAA